MRPAPRIVLALVFAAGSPLAGSEEDRLEAVLRDALAAEGQGRFADAARAYREALRIRPDIAHLHYGLAWVSLRQGLLTDALEEAGRAVELAPDEAVFYLLRGRILRALDRIEPAERDFVRAVELQPAGEGHLDLADLYQSRREFEKSAASLREYLKHHPKEVEPLYFLGTVLSYRNELEEAHEVLSRVVAADPSHARAWFRKAHVEAQRPETMEEAARSFGRALELDPSQAYAWYEYGTLLVKLGEDERAVAALERARELASDLPEVDYVLGTLLSRMGRKQEAEAHLERFKERRDRDSGREARERRALAAFGRGRELLEQNRVEEAIEAFLETTELNPRSHQGYAFLAKAHRSLGRLPVAIGYMRRAMELSPGTSEYPYLLSLFLKDRGDPAGALSAIRTALALDPGNGLLHNALGLILTETGDGAGAAAAFEKACALDPRNPAFHLNLAAAYEELGEPARSAEAMERYRDLLTASR